MLRSIRPTRATLPYLSQTKWDRRKICTSGSPISVRRRLRLDTLYAARPCQEVSAFSEAQPGRTDDRGELEVHGDGASPLELHRRFDQLLEIVRVCRV
jgi:hypothetical protein